MEDNAINFTSRVNQDRVQITFPQPVVKLTLTAEQALTFAGLLVVGAEKIKAKRGTEKK